MTDHVSTSPKIFSGSYLRVLDRMIIGELLRTWSAVLAAIVIIIVSRNFISILRLAINGQLAKDTLFHYLGLKIVVVTINILPVSLFIAILLILGRMYRDQEITAMASAGVGMASIYRSIFMVCFPAFLITAGLSLFASPWAEGQMRQLIHKDSQSADIRGIAPGRFSEYSHGDVVVYVEKLTEDKRLSGVFVQDRQHGKLSVVTADKGSITERDDGRYVVLERGERVQGVPGKANLVIEKFEEYAVRIEKKSSELPLSLDAIETPVLWASGQTKELAEVQKRFSTALSILALGFLAVPLAKVTPRSGIYGNIFLAFLIYFSYENVRKIAYSWILRGKLMLWPGFISVYVLVVIVGLILIMRVYGWRWLLLLLRQRGG